MTDPFVPASPGESGARRKRRLVLEIVLIVAVLGGVGAFIVSRGDGGREDLGSQPALARELLAMEQRDQQARNRATKEGAVVLEDSEIGKAIRRVDTANTARLKEIVDEYGWPGRSLVGERASRSAWLLAQHADLDLKFQKRALEMMEAMPDDEIVRRDVAYLSDRVLVAAGKKQRYGTQLECRDGELVGRTPIADKDNVDARRAKVDMEPLADYKQSYIDTYGECPEEDAPGATGSPAR
jgi:hypothetical protein